MKTKYRMVCHNALDGDRCGNNKHELIKKAIKVSKTVALPGQTAEWSVTNADTEKIVAMGIVDRNGHHSFCQIYPECADAKCIRECKMN